MPADRATLADLARRLEGGETGRQMDWDIAAAITGWRADAVPFDHRSDSGVPHLTTSLDAAIALVERELPRKDGWRWKVASTGEAIIWRSWGEPLGEIAELCDQPAAALALALVRALMARGDAG